MQSYGHVPSAMSEKNAPDQSIRRNTWYGSMPIADEPVRRDTYPIYPYHPSSPLPDLSIRRKKARGEQDPGYDAHDHDWHLVASVVDGLPSPFRPAAPKVGRKPEGEPTFNVRIKAASSPPKTAAMVMARSDAFHDGHFLEQA